VSVQMNTVGLKGKRGRFQWLGAFLPPTKRSPTGAAKGGFSLASAASWLADRRLIAAFQTHERQI